MTDMLPSGLIFLIMKSFQLRVGDFVLNSLKHRVKKLFKTAGKKHVQNTTFLPDLKMQDQSTLSGTRSQRSSWMEKIAQSAKDEGLTSYHLSSA